MHIIALFNPSVGILLASKKATKEEASPRSLKHSIAGFKEKLLHKYRHQPKWFLLVGLGVVLISCVLVGSVVVWELWHLDRIYPGVTVAGTTIGGLERSQAAAKLAPLYSKMQQNPLVLSSKDRAWEVLPSSIHLTYDATASARQAFGVGRSGRPITDYKTQLHTLFFKVNLNPAYTVDNKELASKVAEISEALNNPAQSSHIEYVDNQFVVTPSVEGVKVDQERLVANIRNALTHLSTGDVAIPLTVEQPALTADQAQKLVPALTQYQNKPLTLVFEDKKITLDMPTLLTLIDYDKATADGFSLSKEKVDRYIADFAKSIDRPAKDTLFKYEEGRVQAFVPSQDGLEVDRAALAQKIEETLMTGGKSRVIEIPVKRTQAKVTNDQVNDLGIKELIGHGESNYAGSPQDRIFNLTLATNRINGVLIQPDQEFSFNDAVGEITTATGYKQALVILSGKTVLGDGGGVCQVSTTVFRAALNAGLPIVQRTAHAYRVIYYERSSGSWVGPGYDATIYQPGVDLKFKNDTGHAILIQTSVDTAATKINVDIYGTSDGRQVAISKSITTSTTPAPPDINQDDPNLPKGTVKQVEHSIPGAKVSFNRTVTRNGETLIQETFNSNYRPWAAVYLHGTKE